MKIRSGFVSNSSSSSFVLCFPDKSAEEIVNGVKDKILQNEDVRDYYNELDPAAILREFVDFIVELRQSKSAYMERQPVACWAGDVFEDYVVADFSTGPDDGSIALADQTKIKKIMGE